MAKKAQQKQTVEKTKKQSTTVKPSKKNEKVEIEESVKEVKITSEKTKKPANEKLAKEKKKAETKKKIVNTLISLDKNLYIIGAFALGVVITALVTIIIWPERIATLSDGTQPVATVNDTVITADDLYEKMKSYYSVTQLLESIDKIILEEKYPEDTEMNESVESNAQYYLNVYNSYYGYTEEQFLAANGFANYEAFLEYLKLDYRRNKYKDEYVEGLISDDEIQKYYDENVYGAINCQHILVATSDDVSSEDAEKLAQEIIDKLKNGSSWEDVQKEYKDSITFEDLSYQEWDANLETSFMDALYDLGENTYSSTPVETSYGFHVIHRFDQKEKPSFEDEKETVIDKIAAKKESADSKLYNKALISMREEAGLSFDDTNMKNKYDDFCKDYK